MVTLKLIIGTLTLIMLGIMLATGIQSHREQRKRKEIHIWLRQLTTAIPIQGEIVDALPYSAAYTQYAIHYPAADGLMHRIYLPLQNGYEIGTPTQLRVFPSALCTGALCTGALEESLIQMANIPAAQTPRMPTALPIQTWHGAVVDASGSVMTEAAYQQLQTELTAQLPTRQRISRFALYAVLAGINVFFLTIFLLFA